MSLFSYTAYCGLTMSNHVDLPPHLQKRYGVHKSAWWAYVTILLLVASLLGLVIYTNYRSVKPSIAGELTTFTVTKGAVQINWKIQRPAGKTIYCAIRAQDRAKTDVGYAIVEIAGQNDQEIVTYELRTNGKAVLAEVLGCGPTQNLRVPPANFPPGLQIPDQPWPGIAPTP